MFAVQEILTVFFGASSYIPSAPPRQPHVSDVRTSISRTTPNICSSSVSPNHARLPGASSFVASSDFPSSVFSSYYYLPSSGAKPTAQPQPAIFDPILQVTFPANLTDPYDLPADNTDPILFPETKEELSPDLALKVLAEIVQNVTSILDNPSLSGCDKCKSALKAARPAAELVPQYVPEAMLSLCKSYGFKTNDTCEQRFRATTHGAVWTQVLAFADIEGEDGDVICNRLEGASCPLPPIKPLDTASLFKFPKPKDAVAPKPSGKRVKVLHISDFHLDPRYAIGSESNCTVSMCCRSDSVNVEFGQGKVSLPAAPFGAYYCDTPYYLAAAALQAVGPLSGTSHDGESLGWTVFTGDVVSHDPKYQLSRAFLEYVETAVFHLFKHYLTGPVFAALGNHDTNPDGQDAHNSLPPPFSEQQSWNYEHVSALWESHGWIGDVEARQARRHYGGYSIKNHLGLRVITLNTDMWYRNNIFNYINTTRPDASGMLRFLIDELESAESAQERVWIVGHIPSGWDGNAALPNPSNLFYQIVDRFSPHVIAGIFFGHTHEDQFNVYYANNGTEQTGPNALMTAWIGPSVTPIKDLNSGFRVYEVDTGDFNIYEAWTFYSDVATFETLSDTGPTYQLEYSTREVYGTRIGWPRDAPLNATFWHAVTEHMEKDRDTLNKFVWYEDKSSGQGFDQCTSEQCAEAKICYMRSGSTALGLGCPSLQMN